MTYRSRHRNTMPNSSPSGGIGFTGALTLLFIGLKLGDVITWPWLWVLSPLWIGFLLGIALLTVAVVIAYWFQK